ncbi:MAG: cysteine synthase A [Clostridia bacterium]|nr:cysteine synthase A [Clostridia bacterium]
MSVYKSLDEMIGNTPLLDASRYAKSRGACAKIYAKIEARNPAGSVKDRAALQMINDAECSGALRPGSVIIEPTSGNTGIGLAAIGVMRGYRVIIVMPNTMSEERQRLIKAYGAELVLTDGALGMSGAIARAKELADELGDAFIPGQFENPSNPRAHELTTGPEIWRDLDGAVDIFVAGVGTGGTLTGVGRYLKEQNKNIRVVAVEPSDSPVLSGGSSGSHGIQGIGAGFIPAALDTEIYDSVVPVSLSDAYGAAREFSRCEGVLVGISSGAALHAAGELAALPENEGKNIVVLLPDGGEKYLSTALFD